ncbi:ATP-dependent RNA helicase DDX51 [Lampris incognitus]|uniref:ATP-dependent RNA helicase DDX51 n=1 Tax=Lampris incognitus TaxID=2546036 RepID=UPI0024B62E09|nr:ATP-dependent RNA helicase DDX51 [Lampris incognitus]
MSLFAVNRYLGEGGEESVSHKESRSKILLARLQQKAKEREGQSLINSREHLPDGRTVLQEAKKKRKQEEDSSQEHKKHSKKRKGELTRTAPSPLPETVSQLELVGKKKKGEKKKQKKSDQSENLVEVLPDTTVKDEHRETESSEEKEERQSDHNKKDAEQDEKDGKIATQTSFKILGGFENKPVRKVHRVLPQWLAQPDVIQRDIKNNLVPVSEVQGLSANLMRKLESNGIQHFFPVQAEVIPAILDSVRQGLLIGRGGYKPRDICVSAPTGSGKTLAFALPVIQALMERVVCQVRALVVLPTKELAQQVYRVFTSYCEGTNLKVVMLAGHKSFAVEQASLLENRGGMTRSLADIVVATPGRLVDHINKNSGFCLDHLRFLVIDEADRMIDSMHQSWLGQVTKAVFRSGSGPEATSLFRRTEPTHITAASLSPPQMPLQKLLFSATLTQNPEKLQQLGLHQPRLFSSVHSHCSPSATATGHPGTQGGAPQTQERFIVPEGLTEYYVPCTLSKKPLIILHFILRLKFSPILCFTNSKEAAHRLRLLLQLFGGVEVAEFSSRLSPAERKKTLRDFERGKIQLLVSTDAAARGIDIDGVKYVVNYDAPQYIRTYIHRAGRTARAGKVGLVFTFLLGIQERKFLQMVQDAGSPGIRKQIVRPGNLQSMEERYEQALQKLATVVKPGAPCAPQKFGGDPVTAAETPRTALETPRTALNSRFGNRSVSRGVRFRLPSVELRSCCCCCCTVSSELLHPFLLSCCTFSSELLHRFV